MKKKQTTTKKAKPTRLKTKAASGKLVAPVLRTGENIDGCDVAVTGATLDHELPAAKGGVA
jgi:hypothetical protein